MKQKIDIGYKVVECCPGSRELVSAVAYPPARRTYQVNEWTHREQQNGPLGVFDNLEDAKTFCKKNKKFPWHIYHCEYVESQECGFYCFEFVLYVAVKYISISRDIPAGTKYADAIKILEEVQGE